MNPLSELTNDATSSMLRTALSMAGMTHQVIAHNIANANSPGFVPLRVRFENELEKAGSSLFTQSAPSARVEPDPDLAFGASAVSSLDAQMARLNENMIRYQMLLRGINQRISLIDMALNDGKR